MSGRRKNVHSWAAALAGDTGIHGWKAFLDSGSHAEWFVWFFVLLAALGLIIKGCIITIIEYRNQPTMVQLSFTAPPKFPEIMVCDPYWADEEKINARGWGPAEYVDLGYMFVQPLFTTLYNLNGGIGVKLSEAQNETMASVIKSISFTERELMDESFALRGSVSLEYVHTGRGPCVLVDNDIDLSPADADHAYIYLAFNRAKPAFNITQSQGQYLELYAGTNLNSRYPEGGLAVGRRKSVDVKMEGTKVKFVRNCNKSDGALAYGSSKSNALDGFCRAMDRPPFFSGQPEMKFGEAGSYLKPYEQICDLAVNLPNGMDIKTYFAENTQEPCEFWRYTLSAVPLDDSSDEKGRDVFSFSLLFPTHALFIEEQFTITTDGFLSNLGGQISLWSGASIVTLIHVLMFCCCKKRGTGPAEGNKVKNADPE